jgi:hypothetical protein
MSIVSIKIFNESDNYVSNREPHFDDNFVWSIFNDIHRAKDNLVVKKGVNNIEYFYDKFNDEFYLIKHDKQQNINRKIRISHYKFYDLLYGKLIKFV